ncbi:hypothetical protein ACLKA7_013483 [Drosophila subpalustris]
MLGASDDEGGRTQLAGTLGKSIVLIVLQLSCLDSTRQLAKGLSLRSGLVKSVTTAAKAAKKLWQLQEAKELRSSLDQVQSAAR